MPRYREEERRAMTLDETLAIQTVGDLRPVAKLLTAGRTPTRKAELVAFVASCLEGPRLRALWDRLDTLQQAAVAETAHDPGRFFQARRFRAKYGANPNWGKTDSFSTHVTEPSLLAALFFRGVMPEDLGQRLRAFVPEPEPARLEVAASLPEALARQRFRWNRESERSEEWEETVPVVRREMEPAALHDLPAVLHLIGAGKVAVGQKTRRPGAAALQAIGKVLLAGDYYDGVAPAAEIPAWHHELGPIRAFAWPLLVQAGGLAELSGKNLALTRAGQRALTAPAQKTIETLWRRWLKTRLLDEMARIEVVKGQGAKGRGGALTAAVDRHPAVNDALARCPVGAWVAVDELFRYMQAADLDFEVARDPWKLHIGSNARNGSLGYQGYHGWHLLQARYALCLLFEYAATLGLIDVAYVPPQRARPDYSGNWGTDDFLFLSRYDGLLYLRLTPLGAYCLGLSGAYVAAKPEPRAALRVLPNLDVVATGEALDPGDAFLLDSFARRQADAVWRLERAKLLAALEEGKTVAALRELLESRNEGPLPDTVSRFLQDCEERASALKDRGEARLVECADPALAALVANDSRTRPLCMQAGERHLVVLPGAEKRFRTALRKLGYPLLA